MNLEISEPKLEVQKYSPSFP